MPKISEKKPTTASPDEVKTQIYWKILTAAIALDFEKGHQRWSISELARRSKVTRTLIYYYFGKSRTDILAGAVKMISERLFGFSKRDNSLWKRGKIPEAVMDSKHLIEQQPVLVSFYFAHRFRDTEIGKNLRAFEKRYLEKIAATFPQLSAEDRPAFFWILVGLTVGSGITEPSVRRILAGISRS